MIFCKRRERVGSGVLVASDFLKTSVNAANECSYIVLMADSVASAKKRIAPLFAAAWYPSRNFYINIKLFALLDVFLYTSSSSAVTLASSNFSAISMDLALVSSSVVISS